MKNIFIYARVSPRRRISIRVPSSTFPTHQKMVFFPSLTTATTPNSPLRTHLPVHSFAEFSEFFTESPVIRRCLSLRRISFIWGKVFLKDITLPYQKWRGGWKLCSDFRRSVILMWEVHFRRLTDAREILPHKANSVCLFWIKQQCQLRNSMSIYYRRTFVCKKEKKYLQTSFHIYIDMCYGFWKYTTNCIRYLFLFSFFILLLFYSVIISSKILINENPLYQVNWEEFN